MWLLHKRSILMPSTKRRYDKEEFARRGDNLYETTIRPRLNSSDKGKFAAIDIESGDFEVNEDQLAAGNRLRSRRPEAQMWMVRIGFPYLHRFGGWDGRSTR